MFCDQKYDEEECEKVEYIISASTDIGNVKMTNQDSLGVKALTVREKKVVLAVLCDGVGGLEKGEVASATMVKAFSEWAINRLPYLTQAGISEETIQNEWTKLIAEYNEKIKAYGKKCGVKLGTTIAAILLVENKYYIVNIGDSRVYEIFEQSVVLTRDQTIVAKELELGFITPEQAAVDSRRNILLQCIGVSDEVYPDFFFGDVKKNAVYMLCSDGFRHEISSNEIYAVFRPDNMMSVEQMKINELALIQLNKQRDERDNISVITIKTY